MSASTQSIIVIGAGIAGITAARELQLRGKQVLILEADGEIGGRLGKTRKLKAQTDEEVPIDLGGFWLHGPGPGYYNRSGAFAIDENPLYTLSRELGIDFMIGGQDPPVIFGKSGETNEDIRREAEDTCLRIFSYIKEVYIPKLQHSKIDVLSMSLADGWNYALENLEPLNPMFRDPKSLHSNYLNYYKSYWQNLDNTQMEDISLQNFTMGIVHDGPDIIAKPAGFKTIIDRLASGLNIKLNNIVVRIIYGQNGVRVDTISDSFYGIACIVTVPLGILKKGDIRFQPELPLYKTLSISRLGFGLMNKLVMIFDKVFWEKDTISLGFARESENTFNWIGNVYPFTGKPILIAFFVGNFAKSISTKTDEQVVEIAIKTLRIRYGDAVTWPISYMVTHWEKEPFCLGSYSYLKVGSMPSDFESLGRSMHPLYFAGEHCSPDYVGFAHGAYLSGLNAAKELHCRLNSISKL
eukprot:TRINITY_DN7045_c0_g1_i1.p1 TRINITY_DN7045_c0_g1~~TRINITY_DN7045_c0_g1_i1.p1  ORF type:complete len:467 (+),score=70.75 TRINITY_DN7045_c0_g1_i1:74-1474(+)